MSFEDRIRASDRGASIQDNMAAEYIQGGFFDCSALKMTKYKEK